MPAFAITTLSARDHDALVQLWDEAGLHHFPSGRDARDALVTQMSLSYCRFMGIRGEGGALEGAAIATHEGRKGWINRLAVRPSARRTGMARALVAACEDWLISQGIGLFAALVEGDNRDSQALFSACDYDRDDTLVYFRKAVRQDI